MSTESTYEKYLRIGTKYDLAGTRAREFFVSIVSDTPPEVRMNLFTHQWVVGCVAGLIFAKNPHVGEVPAEEISVLCRIVAEAFSQMQQTPYTGDRN